MKIPIYDYLCPVCGKELFLKEKSYVCENQHLFDVSKSGYVNLLPVNKKNSVQPGDNKDMIKARVDIMEKNYYKCLADKIISLISHYNPLFALDAGCGMGYIADRIKKYFPSCSVLGTDISKFAVMYASRKYKNIPFAVASSNALPIKNHSLDVIICAFAPVFSEEFARTLKKDGILVRVSPGAEHLMDLKKHLYDTPLPNLPDSEEFEGFSLIKEDKAVSIFTAEGNEIISLVQMTPYYYHADRDLIEKINALSVLQTKLEFDIRMFKKLY